MFIASHDKLLAAGHNQGQSHQGVAMAMYYYCISSSQLWFSLAQDMATVIVLWAVLGKQGAIPGFKRSFTLLSSVLTLPPSGDRFVNYGSSAL